MRWVTLAITTPLVLSGSVTFFIVGNLISWLAGAMTGLGVCVWVLLRDSPPDYIENWRVGAEGEQKTAKVLRPLERHGLHVVHDIQCCYGNYDHIAVGSSGVLLLETKNLSGVVEIGGGVPRLRRRLDPKAEISLQRVGPRTLATAATLKKDIEARTGHRTWVQAVVVFWSDFPAGVVDDGRCVFIHGPRLREWIESRPPRLSLAVVDEIAVAVESLGADVAEETELLETRLSHV